MAVFFLVLLLARAVGNGPLDVGCLIAYKKPRPRERTRVITPDEFRAILRSSGAPSGACSWPCACVAADPANCADSFGRRCSSTKAF